MLVKVSIAVNSASQKVDNGSERLKSKGSKNVTGGDEAGEGNTVGSSIVVNSASHLKPG